MRIEIVNVRTGTQLLSALTSGRVSEHSRQESTSSDYSNVRVQYCDITYIIVKSVYSRLNISKQIFCPFKAVTNTCRYE